MASPAGWKFSASSVETENENHWEESAYSSANVQRRRLRYNSILRAQTGRLDASPITPGMPKYTSVSLP